MYYSQVWTKYYDQFLYESIDTVSKSYSGKNASVQLKMALSKSKKTKTKKKKPDLLPSLTKPKPKPTLHLLSLT